MALAGKTFVGTSFSLSSSVAGSRIRLDLAYRRAGEPESHAYSEIGTEPRLAVSLIIEYRPPAETLVFGIAADDAVHVEFGTAGGKVAKGSVVVPEGLSSVRRGAFVVPLPGAGCPTFARALSNSRDLLDYQDYPGIALKPQEAGTGFVSLG